jgi:predicted DCC family thiol-disulfide oxidoreductase YuxK
LLQILGENSMNKFAEPFAVGQRAEHPIVFFDGECGLCNRFVQFVLDHDKNRTFRFAPLQGSTAMAKLPEKEYRNLDSIVFLDKGKCLRKSTAVIAILRHLGGFFKLTSFLRAIPRPLRDAVYDAVAERRKRLTTSCRIPSEEERKLFLA